MAHFCRFHPDARGWHDRNRGNNDMEGAVEWKLTDHLGARPSLPRRRPMSFEFPRSGLGPVCRPAF